MDFGLPGISLTRTHSGHAGPQVANTNSVKVGDKVKQSPKRSHEEHQQAGVPLSPH